MVSAYLLGVMLLVLKGEISFCVLTSFLKVLIWFYIRWPMCVPRVRFGKCGVWFRFVLPKNLVFVSLCSKLPSLCLSDHFPKLCLSFFLVYLVCLLAWVPLLLNGWPGGPWKSETRRSLFPCSFSAVSEGI